MDSELGGKKEVLIIETFLSVRVGFPVRNEPVDGSQSVTTGSSPSPPVRIYTIDARNNSRQKESKMAELKMGFTIYIGDREERDEWTFDSQDSKPSRSRQKIYFEKKRVSRNCEPINFFETKGERRFGRC